MGIIMPDTVKMCSLERHLFWGAFRFLKSKETEKGLLSTRQILKTMDTIGDRVKLNLERS